MSLQNIIDRSTSSMIQLLHQQGLAITVTYQQTSSPVYNPVTGASSGTTTSKSVKGVLSNYQQKEIDGQFIRPQDAKFITTTTLLQGVVPTVEDQFVYDGATWSVVSIQKAPGGTVFLLQVRRLG